MPRMTGKKNQVIDAQKTWINAYCQGKAVVVFWDGLGGPGQARKEATTGTGLRVAPAPNTYQVGTV